MVWLFSQSITFLLLQYCIRSITSINCSACLTHTVQMFVEITVIPFVQYYSFIFLSTEFCAGMHVGGGVINLCHLRVVRYTVAQLVEVLLYKSKVMGSIPNGVIGIFH